MHQTADIAEACLLYTARHPAASAPLPVPPLVWQDGRMSQTFGMESPRNTSDLDPTPHRPPVRFLVVIDSGGSMVARLFLPSRELAAEFDAMVEEVTVMTQGLMPETGATGPEWDVALQGHNATERAAALVYTLPI